MQFITKSTLLHYGCVSAVGFVRSSSHYKKYTATSGMHSTVKHRAGGGRGWGRQMKRLEETCNIIPAHPCLDRIPLCLFNSGGGMVRNGPLRIALEYEPIWCIPKKKELSNRDQKLLLPRPLFLQTLLKTCF